MKSDPLYGLEASRYGRIDRGDLTAIMTEPAVMKRMRGSSEAEQAEMRSR